MYLLFIYLQLPWQCFHLDVSHKGIHQWAMWQQTQYTALVLLLMNIEGKRLVGNSLRWAFFFFFFILTHKSFFFFHFDSQLITTPKHSLIYATFPDNFDPELFPDHGWWFFCVCVFEKIWKNHLISDVNTTHMNLNQTDQFQSWYFNENHDFTCDLIDLL